MATQSMRVLAIIYSVLLLADGVLSIIDRARTGQVSHFSTWTTITLCLISLPVLIVGFLLGRVFDGRPRWPLLLSSGAYSAMLIVLLGVVVFMAIQNGLAGLDSPVLSESAGRMLSLVVGGCQVVLGAVCLAGALGRVRRREPVRRIA